MSASLIVLLLAAAGVAIFHAILPDHWVPIAVVARAQRWSMGRTTRVATWTAIGHVLGSIGLGIVIIAFGYGLKGIVRLEAPIVGIVLVLSGIGLFWWSLRKPGHSHPHPPGTGHGHAAAHGSDHPHAHPHHAEPRRGAWLIPAGIAASPDPTILPVFLAAIAVNVGAAIEVLIDYSLVTMVAMVGLTLVTAWGGYQVKWDWLEHHANQVTAAILVALGIAAWLAF